MAWLAVDKDGTEFVYKNKPDRGIAHFVPYQYVDSFIELPNGSIKKLIGRDMVWEDKPIELKGE